jgi:hypothetical protein
MKGKAMASRVDGVAHSNRWRVIAWGAAVALILAPLVAMQFPASGVNWTISDFIFAAALVGVVGGLFELAARASGSWAYRGGAGLALLTSFLLVWINGAVGIIGNEDNRANLVFGVIILMAIAGTIVAKARAAGMVRGMAVATVAQAVVGLVVFAQGIAANEPPGAFGMLVLIEGFALLWAGSALLFRRAARSGN